MEVHHKHTHKCCMNIIYKSIITDTAVVCNIEVMSDNFNTFTPTSDQWLDKYSHIYNTISDFVT
jgi:hypothetical protein